MSPFAWIIAASLTGGLLSVLVAAALTLAARAAWIPWLLSYAIGTLLGAAFLEMLPEAMAHGRSIEQTSGIVLLGIVVFFVLEKLVLWRHHHIHHSDGHDPALSPGVRMRGGLLILIGDTIHNFVDGVLIAAAFLTNLHLGIVTALAIIAHEIPQEAGDFLVLLHSGFSKAKALLFNLLSSMAMLLGALIGYAGLDSMRELVPPLLGFAAASMIYVAVADLIPDLHRTPALKAGAIQVLLIALGVASIWVVGELAGGHAH